MKRYPFDIEDPHQAEKRKDLYACILYIVVIMGILSMFAMLMYAFFAHLDCWF